MNSTQLCTLNEMEIHAINIYFLEIMSLMILYCLFGVMNFSINLEISFFNSFVLDSNLMSKILVTEKYFIHASMRIKRNFEMFFFIFTVAKAMRIFAKVEISQNIFRIYQMLLQFILSLFIYLGKIDSSTHAEFLCSEFLKYFYMSRVTDGTKKNIKL
ncbi:hypothetical protein ACKWTF_013827 [Chironomus riparius]